MLLSSSFVRRDLLAVALTSLLFSVPAVSVRAAGDVAPDSDDLDRVVVTAARGEQIRRDALAAVSVVTRDDIERQQPSTLTDLLRGLPGISISNNGGAGKATSVFLRGTESDHVLVLVDGIRIGSATLGTAAFQDIPVDQIERIEIVRGPYSSLYGSEALGGVIQIFTRRPQGAFVPTLSLAVGSDDTQRASAGVAGRAGNGWYSINTGYEHTDGINACRGAGAPVFAGCFTDEPDLDGYRNASLSAQGGYRFNEQWDGEAHVLRAEARNEYDGGFSNRSSVEQQAASARLRWRPSEAVSLTLNVGRSADLSDNFLNAASAGTFDTHRSQASLLADFVAGGARFTLGYDWLNDEVESDTGYVVDQRIARGLFGQWRQRFGAHGLQVSLRRDDNSQFGGKTTGSVQWGWDFVEGLRLSASYGTAYKAPTFNELYYPFFGNPDLTPENSRSFEIGLRGTQDWGGWSVNGFATRVDDLIGFDASFNPVNIDETRIRGVEATLDTEIAGWDVNASATWLDPRNEGAGGNHGNVLPRRARRTARVDIDRTFGDFGVGASVNASGERYNDLANSERLGGYATTDVRVSYGFNPSWTLQLNVNNLFDKRYETAQWFNQSGRTWMLTLRYRRAED